MKALTNIGQKIIDYKQSKLIHNRKNLTDLLRQLIEDFDNLKIETVKERILDTRDLAFESLGLAFHSGRGLVADIFNEEVDSKRHNVLSDVSDNLYDVYCNLLKCGPSHSMKFKLSGLVNSLNKMP